MTKRTVDNCDEISIELGLNRLKLRPSGWLVKEISEYIEEKYGEYPYVECCVTETIYRLIELHSMHEATQPS